MNDQSWGNYPFHPQKVLPFHSKLTQNSYLMRGLGRSYGDVCLSPGTLLTQEKQNYFLEFDPKLGLLTCQPGSSLAKIITWLGPQGWIPAVLPGTQHVTVGGAVANDIHGKNHHRDGSFGNHVKHFQILHKGVLVSCSPTENTDLFKATIGGLGLTGSLVTVTLKLTEVEGPYLNTETIALRNLDDFFKLSDEGENTYRYSVAWIDSTAKGKALGKGLFFRANHIKKAGSFSLGYPKISIPFPMPQNLLNPWVLKLFNKGYGLKRWMVGQTSQHLNPFFFPLDSIGNWNRLYGRKGFIQYQCVTPNPHTIERILHSVSTGGHYSFLSVLKKFGKSPSIGHMSFAKPGYTLAMDFTHRGGIKRLMDKWDQWIIEDGGSLYLAKDSRMTPQTFLKLYPQYEEWIEFLDPNCNSYLKRRLMEPNL